MLEKITQGVPIKRFFRDLLNEIQEDNVSNGAAALGFYLMLAIFPAMIFLLTLLPYLPIPNLDKAVMDLLRQALPGEAADMFSGVIENVTSDRRGGLLSFGLLFTLWAAANGMYAIMQQLNITYDVKEGRPFWKTRGTAIFLTLLFGALIISAFSLIVFGGKAEEWLVSSVGLGWVLTAAFAVFRWLVVAAALLLGFAVVYYWGPDVEQEFRFVTPGSVLGAALLVLATLAFKLYVTNFGKYSATYGSIGAVIVFMLWLNITGLVLLLGSEVNALIEHYSSEGKRKGQKSMAA